ncbi:MAG TPA: DEAD/DEAH box helicase, partial [Acidimicrobiales bacterium]|nr:DEAD/DEAH box helicase [Acidimicrobiales bacterium]
LLRRLGDLGGDELRARAHGDFADALVATRRAVLVRVAGEPRLIAAEDAALYRDGLGCALPTGLPEAFLEAVADPLLSIVRRWARTHGPFVAREPGDRLGVPVELVESVLVRLVDAGRLDRGEFRPDGIEREWCDIEVLRLLRQRSLAVLRREVEPTSTEALARFLPAWHGVGSDAGGVDRLYEVIAQLQGVAIPASVLERDVLRSRVRDYSPRLLDDLLAAGEVAWVGAGPLGRDDGKVMLVLRERARLLLHGWSGSGERPGDPEHDRLRVALEQRGACFFRELAGTDQATSLSSLWDLVWAGEVTNDSFAPLRARSSKASAGGARRGGRPRLGSLTNLGPPRAQGRWSLVRRDLGLDIEAAEGAATLAAHARAAALLERHGVLTREAVRGEGVPRGFAGVYPVLRAMEESGRIRRGYFVAGLGGAQFALPGAVDRLRSFRDDTPSGLPRVIILAATDPANAYGLSLPWPVKGPQRAAGAFVVLIDGLASLYVERSGKSLVSLRDHDGSWENEAVGAVASLIDLGRFKRLLVERFPPQLLSELREHGFLPTPKGLARYA